MVVHSEESEDGHMKEEMPGTQDMGDPLDGYKLVSVQDSVVWESWHAWEDSLRVVHRMLRAGAVALQGELSEKPLVQTEKLTEQEQGRLEKWKR